MEIILFSATDISVSCFHLDKFLEFLGTGYPERWLITSAPTNPSVMPLLSENILDKNGLTRIMDSEGNKLMKG